MIRSLELFLPLYIKLKKYKIPLKVNPRTYHCQTLILTQPCSGHLRERNKSWTGCLSSTLSQLEDVFLPLMTIFLLLKINNRLTLT